MHHLAANIGESDCELLGSGLLVQPYNAWSSSAYVVVGILVALRGWRSPKGGRFEQVLYGVVVAAIGVGSVAFHGPQPSGARLLHDLPIAAAFAFIFLFDVAAIFGWSRQRMVWSFGGLVTVLGLVFASVPDASVPLTAPLVLAAVVSEAVVYRRRLRETSARSVALYVGIAVALGTAAVLNVLGRTDGPLCAPDGALQLHGIWHVLTAAAFGLWAYVGFPARDRVGTSPAATGRT